MSDYESEWEAARRDGEIRRDAEIESLRARLAAQRATIQDLDCAYGETGGIHCPLEQPCLRCRLAAAEQRALMAQLDDSKRDELAALKAEVATLTVALADQNQPCDGIGCPRGKEAVALQKQVTKLTAEAERYGHIEKELIEARTQVATLTAELKRLQATERRCQCGDDDVCALVAERDALKDWQQTAKATMLALGDELAKTRAGQAMLREALVDLLEYAGHIPYEPARMFAAIDRARAALATSPGDWLAGERRRIAEAVANRCEMKAGFSLDLSADLAALLKEKP